MRPSEEFLRPCGERCGAKAGCTRVIDRRDSSVLPAIDTGFRIDGSKVVLGVTDPLGVDPSCFDGYGHQNRAAAEDE